MNFKPLTVQRTGRYTAADQAAAFEQLIQADSYLSSHRGQYAERNAVFLPIVNRIDLSITQDLFHSVAGRRHSGADPARHHQLRQPAEQQLGRRPASGQHPDPDRPRRPTRTGKLTYNLQTLSGNLITSPLQTSAGHRGRLRDDAQLQVHVPVTVT